MKLATVWFPITTIYVDQISPKCIYQGYLGQLLNTAYTLIDEPSTQQIFEFNASMSKVIVFGTDAFPSLKLMLGGENILSKDGGS